MRLKKLTFVQVWLLSLCQVTWLLDRLNTTNESFDLLSSGLDHYTFNSPLLCKVITRTRFTLRPNSFEKSKFVVNNPRDKQLRNNENKIFDWKTPFKLFFHLSFKHSLNNIVKRLNHFQSLVGSASITKVIYKSLIVTQLTCSNWSNRLINSLIT